MRAALRTLACAATFLLWAATVSAQVRALGPESPGAIRAAHAGQPWVLALWSLHCAPCQEDLALLAALHRRRPDLALVLVAADDPAEAGAVRERLRAHGLDGLEAWVFGDAAPERLRHALDPRWRGELPRT